MVKCLTCGATFDVTGEEVCCPVCGNPIYVDKLRELEKQVSKYERDERHRNTAVVNVDITPQPEEPSRPWLLLAVGSFLGGFVLLLFFKMDWIASLVGAAILSVVFTATYGRRSKPKSFYRSAR